MINLTPVPTFEHTSVRIVSLDAVYLGMIGQLKDFTDAGLLDAAETVEIPPTLWVFWSEPSRHGEGGDNRKYYVGDSAEDALRQAFVIADEEG